MAWWNYVCRYNESMNFAALRLHTITMYRLMLYFLIALLGVAIVLSAGGVLPYSPGDILLQAAIFVAVCWVTNTLIAWILKITPNIESSLITGLILAAIAGPLSLPSQWFVLVMMAVVAIASKYIFAWQKSHIFNPAAFGVAFSAVVLGYPASWWIGSAALLPVILIGGILMMQKIRRWHLVASFLGVYLGLLVLDALLMQGHSLPGAVVLFGNLLFSPLLLFFVFVMLVEPLTAPQTTARRVAFGVTVGIVLFALQRLAGTIPYSLELSLLAGNVFARLINPDFRQVFVLRRKEFLSSTIGSFWFEPTRRFVFAPGQFLEYTFAHSRPDARGVRRYFSIASSPTEPQVSLTARFSEPGSTYKQALRQMREGDEIVASKVAGDFVLPSNPAQKLVFIAGGIGITPFRSIVRYLLDTNQSRDIVLLYGAREEKDLVFRETFEEAHKKFGMRNVYAVGHVIDDNIIKKEIPDFAERLCYVSGPEPMVQGLTKLLASVGIPRRQIKRDYFPGYAEKLE